MNYRRQTIFVFCLSLAAWRAVPAADPAAEPIAMGPFHLGMTFEEARAAAPQLQWQEGAPRNNPYRKVLLAANAKLEQIANSATNNNLFIYEDSR